MTARRTPRTGPSECNILWWAYHFKHRLWMPNEDPTKPKCYGPKLTAPVATKNFGYCGSTLSKASATVRLLSVISSILEKPWKIQNAWVPWPSGPWYGGFLRPCGHELVMLGSLCVMIFLGAQETLFFSFLCISYLGIFLV